MNYHVEGSNYYIKLLEGLLGISDEPLSDREKPMMEAIELVGEVIFSVDDPELYYRFGNFLRCYSSWFVRGEARVVILFKTVLFLELARARSENIQSVEKYSEQLAYVLVEEAKVRDLARALSLFEPIYAGACDYKPALCSYADALYKCRRYEDAAGVAERLAKLSLKSSGTVGQAAPATRRIAAKAYRALISECVKTQDVDRAEGLAGKLLATGMQTEGDLKKLRKLGIEAGG